MDYEARARELIVHAQENLEDLWVRSRSETAGTFLDSFTTNPTELTKLRHAYVRAAGFWLGEALTVLNNAPRGPYVDHLGAWYNTTQLRRDRMLRAGWGEASPTDTFIETLPGEIQKQAGTLFKGGGAILVLALAVWIGASLLRK